MGPYQMHLENYPMSSNDGYPRIFQYTWFNLFSSWLEYSIFTIKRCCILLIVLSFL